MVLVCTLICARNIIENMRRLCAYMVDGAAQSVQLCEPELC